MILIICLTLKFLHWIWFLLKEVHVILFWSDNPIFCDHVAESLLLFWWHFARQLYLQLWNLHTLCLQLSSQLFGDLLDSIIVDVASECHRIARLGLDRSLEEEEEELKLSLQARAKVADSSNDSETSGKHVVDIFGQNHPTVANDIFDCMNCGRSITAGRFAPHLEKCMGKVLNNQH